MEAKELMLNDLVYRKEHFEFHKPVPRSVVKIDGVMDNDIITFAPYSEFLDMDEIEPISLTAEILAKNFEVGYNPSPYYSLNNKSKIEKDYLRGGYVIEVITKWVDIPICKIKYVHELQHALRLVGLTEVADNLKVE